MPSATEGPAVTMSFANNFWGKEDAGVGPLLDRMASAKQTSDELRSFYSARASIEDDYARKLLALSKKALGSHEMGSLKDSLDSVRTELESMGKQHANTAAHMKSELEEPLAAFAGGMKERRKIIQNTVEKLLKVKIQQTQTVNKTRDRYEQDCLRIKGYLAQGHMVMGHEERKNKAKLEKTQISLASTNAEYEQAVKALEDTTARWNREWKAAADKFQDLEEERLDFSKSSLWTFANLASTVCVSDDTSCEKIRLALENMDVENDIMYFIKEKGTGQEIPDAPKYINFCRGDVDDHKSDVSDDDNYSVAQFPRSINPAFRSSSPQPSTFDSHHDPNSALAREMGHFEPVSPLHPEQPANIPSPHSHPHGHPQTHSPVPPQNVYPPTSSHQNSRPTGTPRRDSYPRNMTPQDMAPLSHHHSAMVPQDPYGSQGRRGGHPAQQQYDAAQFNAVPHDPYPMDGMTMLCRTDGTNSAANQRPSSRYGGGMKPSATTSNVSARIEALNTAKAADSPARYEVASPLTGSNRSSRFDMMKPSATTSNIPARIDGLNTATSSNISAPIEGMNSATSSNISAPDDNSEYSNPTSLSSQEPPSGKVSPVKQQQEPVAVAETPPAEQEKRMLKKRSGFFQNHSPFRRKSTKDVAKEARTSVRSTWPPAASRDTTAAAAASPRRPTVYQPEPKNNMIADRPAERTASPDPIDANATLALNVGGNVFPVANTDKRNQSPDKGSAKPAAEMDPIALALAELKEAAEVKHTTSRVSADRWHGISTPVPDRTAAHERKQSVAQERPATRQQEQPQEQQQQRTPLFSRPVPAPRASNDSASTRGTPPPLYDTPTPVQRLGVPPPAVTSKAMQEASRKYTGQTRQMLSQSRPGSVYGGGGGGAQSRPASRQAAPAAAVPRAASPAAPRSVSPRPTTRAAAEQAQAHTRAQSQSQSQTRPATRGGSGETRPDTRHTQAQAHARSASPNPPYAAASHGRSQSRSSPQPAPAQPNPAYARSEHRASPQPTQSQRRGSEQGGGSGGYYQGASSPGGGMHSRSASRAASPSPSHFRADSYDQRPTSSRSTRGGGGSGSMAVQLASVGSDYGSVRSRPGTSQSYRAMSVYGDGGSGGGGGMGGVTDPSRQYTPEGRAILHYARALYMYQAAIPEELGFAKGDVLAVLRHQDDGWWEAEIHSGSNQGAGGLVPKRIWPFNLTLEIPDLIYCSGNRKTSPGTSNQGRLAKQGVGGAGSPRPPTA
ncbi:hypothetical protein F4808DRAFT_463020 [Astrocystis sublimbata]|nr:hypothetical protein F4808DRAFT_463020 [Astrocystis sublimbata]